MTKVVSSSSFNRVAIQGKIPMSDRGQPAREAIQPDLDQLEESIADRIGTLPDAQILANPCER